MYNNILIPMDLDHIEMYPKAVELAIQLLGESGGKIHSLYVDQSKVHAAGFRVAEDKIQEARQAVKQRVAEEFEQHVPKEYRAKCHIRNGVAYDEILEEEKRVQPDVIIVAAGKPRITSYLLGSNAEKVLRHANSSVFVIRDNKRW